jgi:hypothetical protein
LKRKYIVPVGPEVLYSQNPALDKAATINPFSFVPIKRNPYYGGAREKWIAIQFDWSLFGALMPSDCCKYTLFLVVMIR